MLYKSLRLDKLERHLQIITSFANPWKTNFATTDGPEDANKVWQLFWHWRGTSGPDLQDTFIRLQFSQFKSWQMLEALICLFSRPTCLSQDSSPTSNVSWATFGIYVFGAKSWSAMSAKSLKTYRVKTCLMWKTNTIISKFCYVQLQLHNDHRALVGQTWGLTVAFEVFPWSILCLLYRLQI